MSKARIATVWLDGCSGCHMSLLDIDEKLIEIADKIELVYSPLVDAKVFPENVDVTLVEGAISNEEDLHKIGIIRANTKILVSLGDCAVTGNVPSMRDVFPLEQVLSRAYDENATVNKKVPDQVVPKLCNKVRPVHELVKVDVFVPGCPPSAKTIFYVIAELLEGRIPNTAMASRFGA
ncbi:MAG TPA: NADP oxidoreductase [Clostridia bacterium]|nr:NADP oxidoreductase [Clostridia bacterium]